MGPARGERRLQDIPLWRTLVAQFATGLVDAYRVPVITPMTLVNATYRGEVFDAVRAAGVPLLHVFLEVPADVLRRRITDQEVLDGGPQADLADLVVGAAPVAQRAAL